MTLAVVDVVEYPDRVTVTVRVPVHLNSWGLSRFGGNMTISQSCTLKRELMKHSI